MSKFKYLHWFFHLLHYRPRHPPPIFRRLHNNHRMLHLHLHSIPSLPCSHQQHCLPHNQVEPTRWRLHNRHQLRILEYHEALHLPQHPMQTRSKPRISKPHCLLNLNHSLASDIPTCASMDTLTPQCCQSHDR